MHSPFAHGLQELGRRLKATNPVVAEIFTLMSRDEARHAGFLNKAMSDFNLALDLGFLTKNRCVLACSVMLQCAAIALVQSDMIGHSAGQQQIEMRATVCSGNS